MNFDSVIASLGWEIPCLSRDSVLGGRGTGRSILRDRNPVEISCSQVDALLKTEQDVRQAVQTGPER